MGRTAGHCGMRCKGISPGIFIIIIIIILLCYHSCTVFPRIEARASISFSRVLYPASIWGRPQIGAGLYLFLYSGNLPYVLIDSAFYRRRVIAASQVVPSGVYEKESVVRGHHIYKTVWTPVIGEELPVERDYVLASTILEYVA